MSNSKAQRLRTLLEERDTVLRPCAYDALSAILIERAGFDVVGTTGYGISASLVGQPDMGFVGPSAMLERTRTIVNATSRPVDVDIDTGHGNALNVHWVVENFIRVGAAAVRLEDQVWPKRCGHMDGKAIIPKEDMVRKIESAVRAKEDENSAVVIGARTDARSIKGPEAVIERGQAYADAGADYIYVESPQTLEEVERLKAEIPAHLAFNIIPGGRTPPFEIEDLEDIGVDFLSVPMVALYPAAKAMQESLRVLKEEKDIQKVGEMGVSWSEFNEIVGFDSWREWELELSSEDHLNERYGTTDIEKILAGEVKETAEKWN
jgi:methylisocitrate lyase